MKAKPNNRFGKTLARWMNKLPGWSAVRDANKGRSSVQAERGNEDSLHSGYAQVKLIASQREAYRNDVLSSSSALQLQLNVVGTCGGRLTFTTADEDFNKSAGRAFRRWARHAEFCKGKCLNEMLQLLLTQLTHQGGDFIAVYDDGILTGGTGSGKVRVFESDEIGNVPDTYLAKQFGKGFTQCKGIVLDTFGRVCGAFVSASQRGKDTFDPDKTITLRLQNPADWTNSNWVFVSQDWRLGDAQVRGIATITHVVNALQDIQAIKDSELAAAKLNASLGIIVSDKDAQPENADLERGLPPLPPCDCGDGGDGNGEGTNGEGTEPPPPPPPAATITGLRESMAAIVDVSPGKDVRSFATDRPNLNVSQYVRDETGAAITVFGMGLQYATLNPDASYSASRAAIQMAGLAFKNLGKKLERNFLDWLALRVVEWHGIAAPEDVDECLFWSWPDVIEIDQTKAESAREKAYSNLTTNLKGEMGYDWIDQIEQTRREIAVCKYGKEHWQEHLAEVQVVHPSERTVSGQIAEQPEEPVENNEGEKKE